MSQDELSNKEFLFLVGRDKSWLDMSLARPNPTQKQQQLPAFWMNLQVNSWTVPN